MQRDPKSNGDPLSMRVMWLVFTIALGVILSLIGAWGGQMQQVDARNEQDIRELDRRVQRVEKTFERMEGKLDTLLEQTRARGRK